MADRFAFDQIRVYYNDDPSSLIYVWLSPHETPYYRDWDQDSFKMYGWHPSALVVTDRERYGKSKPLIECSPEIQVMVYEYLFTD